MCRACPHAASRWLAWAHCEDDFATLQTCFLASKGLLGRVKGKEGAAIDYVVQAIRAQGSMAAENPMPTVGGFLTSNYGYLSDGPMTPAYLDVQSAAHNVEATKTEPDKNTYLVLAKQHGPDPAYDYGTHFVYQGHESGRRDGAGQARAYVTRVNLDADVAHRVTVLASADKAGNPLLFALSAAAC